MEAKHDETPETLVTETDHAATTWVTEKDEAIERPPARKRKRWPWIVGAGALVVVGGVAAAAVLTAKGNEATTVEYMITVNDDDDPSCVNIEDGGYGDIPGADVEVFDGSGTLLGFSELDPGTGCIFTATFEIDRSNDGRYRVTSGNENRGFLNFEESEIVDGKLLVIASLG